MAMDRSTTLYNRQASNSLLASIEAAMANVLFFLVAFVALVFLDPHVQGSRLSLTHVDSAAQLTSAERFRRAVRRSHSRRQAFEGKWSSPSTVVASVNYAGDYEYVVYFGIGSPVLPATAILDTGSDLIWTQCVPCLECLSQPSPYFDPSKSYTFSPVPCSSPFCSNRTSIDIGCVAGSGDRCLYLASYVDGSESRGLLGTETFAFGDGSSIAGITFGCGFQNNGSLSNSTGIVGMGRGLLSLPSQLNPRKFSYCLTPLTSSSSSHLFLGSTASLRGRNRGGLIGSTPLISSPIPILNSFYYLSLLGISLGGNRLPIPASVFQLKPDGSDGTIIDSGSYLTYLNQAGYNILKEEIIKQVRKPAVELPDLGVDLCFSFQGASSLPPMPELVFHFEGADMRFPRDKYMEYVDEPGLLCSVITGTEGTSTFGNYQQQDMHILFDLEADVLSFVPAKCDQL